jgi:hypothetical protein
VVKYLALLSILFSSLCQADLVASVGVGKGIMYHDGTPFERALALGYQFNWGDFFIRPEGGYFLDVSGNHEVIALGRTALWRARALDRWPGTPSRHGAGLPPEPGPDPGRALPISLGRRHRDLRRQELSGPGLEASLSAGFEMPNQGRDFITVQWRWEYP